MTSEDWLPWIDRVYFGAGIAAVFFTAITVGASLVQYRLNARISENKDRVFADFRVTSETRSKELERETYAAKLEGEKANERGRSLEAKAADANERAAIIEERLLTERRLTAHERWRLERVEKSILPRSFYVNWSEFVLELREGKFHPINIILVGRSMEASSFAHDLMIALQQANILGGYFDLSAAPNEGRSIHSSTGTTMITGYSDGDRLAQMLWQKFQIGGGSISAAMLPTAWSMIPKDMNCLVIEENNWTMTGGNGQPGEGLDSHTGADPAPH